MSNVALKPVVKNAIRTMLKNRPGTIRDGLAAGLRSVDSFGIPRPWRRLSPEENLLAGLDLKGKVAYDVGANVGLYTLYFGREVGPEGAVIAFEPVPGTYSKLKTNVAINGMVNVHALNLGVAAGSGETEMAVTGDTGRATMQAKIGQEALAHSGASTVKVRVDSLDNQVAAGLPAPDFVKIDVEGMEYDVLKGMTNVIRAYRPELLIEIHRTDDRTSSRSENAQRIIALLREWQYFIWHVESSSHIGDRNLERAIRGHLYCVPMARGAAAQAAR
jgi:FkbM family methyltransferase